MKNTYEQFMSCNAIRTLAMRDIRNAETEAWEALKRQRKNLTPKEYRILKMWIHEFKNLEESAKELGVTRERVRQLRALAMESWKKNPVK